jgi:Tfp pilus assembly protein PilV
MDRTETGLTIVELLVAVIVIAIGIIGIATLMRESSVIGQRVQERDIAVETAHRYVEELRGKSFPDVGLPYPQNYYETFSVPELTDGVGSVCVTYADTGYLKTVTVGICWKKWGSDAIAGETLVTYITRGGINP